MADTPTNKRLTLPAKIIIFGAINFISCCAFSLLNGGDGLNGESADGRYFLSNHGIHLEVGPVLYYYSIAHMASMVITHISIFITGVINGRSMKWTCEVPADASDSVGDKRFWIGTFLVVVAFPASISLFAHPPLARSIENRVESNRHRSLSEAGSGNEVAGTNIAVTSPEVAFHYPAPGRSRGDVDGDGIEDVLTRYTDVNIGLECSNTPGTQTLFRGEERGRVMATGIDDVDLDGYKDLWWIDAGEYCIRIFYGNGKGGFPTKQLIHTRGDYFETGGFVDADGDGDLDIVARAYCSADDSCGDTSNNCWRWIEIEPCKERTPSP